MKILFIAHFSPPRSGIGSVRAKNIVKYLRKTGYTVDILTSGSELSIKNGRITTWLPGNRQTGVSAKVSATKRKTLRRFIRRWFLIPDPQIFWFFTTVYQTWKLNFSCYDAIISTSSPVTGHLIARYISTRHSIPWLAEFRDLWSENPYTDYPSLRNGIELLLERWTIRPASALVTVSDPIANTLGRIHNRDVWTITNGFDIDEKIKKNETSGHFTIVHTGQLYDGRRDPSHLFLAVKNLVMQRRISADDIRVHFYGPYDSNIFAKFEEPEVEDVFKYRGNVERSKSLTAQKNADCLLLLLWDDPAEIGTYTGKLFEYMLADTFIMAIGGKNNQIVGDLLEKTGYGKLYESTADIESDLMNMIKHKMSDSLPMIRPNSNSVKFDFRHIIEKYQALVETIVATNASN
jgi:glycosyltransferase involved in cell wall biosynthesis